MFTGYYAPHRFSAAQFRYYLSRSQTLAFVARDRHALVGYVLGTRAGGRLKHLARLLSIAVDRRHRQHGVATRLLTRFIDAARRRGCRAVVLEVGVPNKPAIDLFSRRGFVPSERLPAYYTPSVSGIRMRLTLPHGD